MRAGSQDPTGRVPEVQPCNPHSECELDFGSRGLDDLLHLMGTAHGNGEVVKDLPVGVGRRGAVLFTHDRSADAQVVRPHPRAFVRQVQADGAWRTCACAGDCP
jgi:hypothetical protein